MLTKKRRDVNIRTPAAPKVSKQSTSFYEVERRPTGRLLPNIGREADFHFLRLMRRPLRVEFAEEPACRPAFRLNT